MALKLKRRAIVKLMADQGVTYADIARRAEIKTDSRLVQALNRGTCKAKLAGEFARGLGVPIDEIVEIEGPQEDEREGGMRREVICSIAEKEYLDLEEAEAWLGISKGTLYKWRKEGMKVIKIGANTFYSKKNIREFMEQKKYWD